MQAQASKTEPGDCVDRRHRIAAASMRLTNPIADRPHLGHAAADVGQRDSANHGSVILAEHQERIGDAALDVVRIG